MADWVGLIGYTDPAAIPPPNMNSMAQHAGVAVTPTTSLQIDSVFTGLRVIANAIIDAGPPRPFKWALDKNNEPYRQWQDPAEYPVLTNPFAVPIKFPSDGTTRTVVSMGLLMEAFWYVLDRDDLGFPLALEVLNPVFMKVEPDKKTGLPVYKYGSGTDAKVLKYENVVHVPYMTFPGGVRALNGIQYGGVAFALALAAMEFGQRFFAQGASPGYILSTDQKLGQDEIDRIAEKFLVEHSGLQAAHLALVVDSGLTVQKVQSTPDEAQFLQTLDYARSAIAAWIGLPPHLVGGSKEAAVAWGKTIAEQDIQLRTYTLSGYFNRLSEAYSSLLPTTVFAGWGEWDGMRLTPESVAQLIIATRQAGVETKNEIRVSALKRPPLPGGDNLDAPMNSNTSPAVGQLLANEEAGATGTKPPAAPTAPEEASSTFRDTRAVVPQIDVHVAPPEVHIDPPNVEVHVEAPTVRNKVYVPEQAPPTVNVENRVEPTPVTVEGATVNVEPTPVTVESHVEPTPVTVENLVEAPKPTAGKRRLVRDRNGRIIGIEELKPGEDWDD